MCLKNDNKVKKMLTKVNNIHLLEYVDIIYSVL